MFWLLKGIFFRLSFLKGCFSDVINELIGFRISRRYVIDVTTEEFQYTAD